MPRTRATVSGPGVHLPVELFQAVQCRLGRAHAGEHLLALLVRSVLADAEAADQAGSVRPCATTVKSTTE